MGNVIQFKTQDQMKSYRMEQARKEKKKRLDAAKDELLKEAESLDF